LPRLEEKQSQICFRIDFVGSQEEALTPENHQYLNYQVSQKGSLTLSQILTLGIHVFWSAYDGSIVELATGAETRKKRVVPVTFTIPFVQ
jgi:hypothetical protein